MANREIKTKVAIDGEKEYKESLKTSTPPSERLNRN